MKSLKLVFSRESPKHLLIQVKSRHGNFKSSGRIIFEDDRVCSIPLIDYAPIIGCKDSLVCIPTVDRYYRRKLEKTIVDSITKEQFSKKIDVADVIPTKKDIGTLCEFSDDNKDWTNPLELVAILPQTDVERRYICCGNFLKSDSGLKPVMAWAYAKKFNNSSKDDTIEIKPEVVNSKNRLLTTYTWKMEE
jgi:hypothetical protein